MKKEWLVQLKAWMQKISAIEKSKLKLFSYYALGLVLIGVIVFEGFYLWKEKEESQSPSVTKQEVTSKEKSGLTITPIGEDSPEKSSREMQGVSDSGTRKEIAIKQDFESH